MLRGLLYAVLALAPVSRTPAGTEWSYAPESPPAPLAAARFRLFLPAADPPDGRPIRAVIAVADYQAGRELYTGEAWRAFAARERCALLLHTLEQEHPRFRLAKDETAVATLERALDHFATAAGRAELRRVPWILAGLSQSGWQAHAFGNLRPERTLALVLFHASTSPHAPETYVHPGTRDVPALLAMAGLETFPIEMLSFADAGARRGRPWTYLLQPGVPHQRLGPQDFPLHWLRAIIELRLDPEGRLRRVDPGAGWHGVYAEHLPAPGQREALRADLFPPGHAEAGSPAGARVWLPDEATALAWRAAVLAPSAKPAGGR